MTAHFSTDVYGNSDQGSTSFVGTTFAQSISGEEPIFEAYVASNPHTEFPLLRRVRLSGRATSDAR